MAEVSLPLGVTEEIGRIVRTRIVVGGSSDWSSVEISFEFEKGIRQSMGSTFLTAKDLGEFVIGVVKAVGGIECWEDLPGKMCWVRRAGTQWESRIIGLAPLGPVEGIEYWIPGYSR